MTGKRRYARSRIALQRQPRSLRGGDNRFSSHCTGFDLHERYDVLQSYGRPVS